jgi:hypothetical protein
MPRWTATEGGPCIAPGCPDPESMDELMTIPDLGWVHGGCLDRVRPEDYGTEESVQ